MTDQRGVDDEMVARALAASRAVKVQTGALAKAPDEQRLRAALAATLRQQAARVDEVMVEALRFYADKHHFMLGDEDAWDTVSGEPQNFWCDEAGTATVEDGAVARQALTAAIAQNTQGDSEAVDRVAKAIADAAGHGMREKCEHMAHAAIAAYQLATWGHAERARVPAGMVLVPREPTPEMLAAVEGSTCSVRVAEDDSVEYPLSEDECAEIYRNMLAAAPSQRAEVK